MTMVAPGASVGGQGHCHRALVPVVTSIVWLCARGGALVRALGTQDQVQGPQARNLSTPCQHWTLVPSITEVVDCRLGISLSFMSTLRGKWKIDDESQSHFRKNISMNDAEDKLIVFETYFQTNSSNLFQI